MKCGVPLLTLAALAAATLGAATAVLDCIGDAASTTGGKQWRGGDRVLALDSPRHQVAIQFRSTSLKGWRATGAKLVVHFERGRCQGPLLAGYAAKFEERAQSQAARRPPALTAQAPCSEAGAGWWQIDLPVSVAQHLVDEPDGAILLASPSTRHDGPRLHSRETLSFAPRLLVEGVAP